MTNNGYSSRARVLPVELSDVLDDAGVAPPFEPKLELEPGVDGRELVRYEGKAVGLEYKEWKEWDDWVGKKTAL